MGAKNQYHKEVKDLVEYGKTLGFVDEGLRRSGHIRLRHPNGFVTMAATPSSPYSAKNAISQMRRIARGTTNG